MAAAAAHSLPKMSVLCPFSHKPAALLTFRYARPLLQRVALRPSLQACRAQRTSLALPDGQCAAHAHTNPLSCSHSGMRGHCCKGRPCTPPSRRAEPRGHCERCHGGSSCCCRCVQQLEILIGTIPSFPLGGLKEHQVQESIKCPSLHEKDQVHEQYVTLLRIASSS